MFNRSGSLREIPFQAATVEWEILWNVKAVWDGRGASARFSFLPGPPPVVLQRPAGPKEAHPFA